MIMAFYIIVGKKSRYKVRNQIWEQDGMRLFCSAVAEKLVSAIERATDSLSPDFIVLRAARCYTDYYNRRRFFMSILLLNTLSKAVFLNKIFLKQKKDKVRSFSIRNRHTINSL